MKNTKIQAPILLPLNYCSIERAARLLDCEVEDILHWENIGSIQLCIAVDHYCEAQLLDGDCNDWQKANSIFGFEHTNKPLVKHFSPWSSAERIFECGEYSNEIYIKGFWAIDVATYVSTGTLIGRPYTGQNFNKVSNITVKFEQLLSEQNSSAHDLKQAELLKSRLLVMEADLKRLHQAIYGKDVLPNIYNDEELRRNADNSQLVTCDAIKNKSRNTLGQKKMLLSFIRIDPDIKELLDKPTKAFNVAQSKFAQESLEFACSQRTFELWVSESLALKPTE